MASNETSRPLRVLHIGNSFSCDATWFLPQLAKAGGKNLEIYGATIGGCSLESHVNHLNQAKEGIEAGNVYESDPSLGDLHLPQSNISLPYALGAKLWDIVTIQQVSHLSFCPETYEPFASQLIAEIRERAPGATIAIHQTWAYRPDHPCFIRKDFGPDLMQTQANRAYEKLASDHDITTFLPTGLAIQIACRSDEWCYRRDPKFEYNQPLHDALPVEQSLYVGPCWAGMPDEKGLRKVDFDASHLNDAGRYLASCVWYEILFNDSPLDVDYTPESLNPAQAASLKKIARKAVESYRINGLSGTEVPVATSAKMTSGGQKMSSRTLSRDRQSHEAIC